MNQRSFYRFQAIALDESIPEDTETVSAIAHLRTNLRSINMKADDDLLVDAENLTYAGQAVCVDCHTRQQEFLSTQKHARAFDSLTRTNTDGDVTCIGCQSPPDSADPVVYSISVSLNPINMCNVKLPRTRKSAFRQSGENPVSSGGCCVMHHMPMIEENSDEVIDTRLIELFHCPSANIPLNRMSRRIL